jgi:hypothetical protein
MKNQVNIQPICSTASQLRIIPWACTRAFCILVRSNSIASRNSISTPAFASILKPKHLVSPTTAKLPTLLHSHRSIVSEGRQAKSTIACVVGIAAGIDIAICNSRDCRAGIVLHGVYIETIRTATHLALIASTRHVAITLWSSSGIASRIGATPALVGVLDAHDGIAVARTKRRTQFESHCRVLGHGEVESTTAA